MSYHKGQRARLSVRLPRGLHRRMVTNARNLGLDLNTYLGTVLLLGAQQQELSHAIPRLVSKLDDDPRFQCT